MKKITLSLIAATIMASQSGHIQAQENTKFDFNSAGNYGVIFLDEETAAGIQDKIMLDLTTAQIDVWSEGETLDFNTTVGGNSQGVGGGAFIELSVVGGIHQWSGGGFNTGVRDLTKIKDHFRFHMAIRSEESDPFLFMITGAKEGENEFTAEIVLGQEPFDGVQPFDDFERDGDWHIIDISVEELKAEGWKAGIIDYSPFSFLLGGNSGTTVALDAIFYYEPEGSSGMESSYATNMEVLVGERTITVLGGQDGLELYNISGTLVKSSKENVIGIENMNKGIYLLKSGTLVKKVYIK